VGKHILVISQYFYPEQFRINDIAAEWVKRGYKVTVITGIPNYPQGKYYDGYGLFKKRKDTYKGVEIIRIPLIPRGKSPITLALNYFSFAITGFFWKCFTKIKADYVFIFEVSPMTQALLGVWYAKKLNVPCYMYVQDLWPESVEVAAGIHNKKVLRQIGKMVDYIYKRCNTIFATSESFCKAIAARGIDENKLVYWPQYAEDFYKPSKIKSNLIPQDGIINITFAGNIGTAQGLEALPEAAVFLKNENIKVRFNIVGDGRNKEFLLKQITEKQVQDYFNIVSLQPAESIPSILAASDAAFVSFQNDKLYAMTIPAKLQSYMACGIPIIGSVIGESKNIIDLSGCGLTSDVGNAKQLVEQIKLFISKSPAERIRMGENAVAYSNLHFNRENLFELIEKYFTAKGV